MNYSNFSTWILSGSREFLVFQIVEIDQVEHGSRNRNGLLRSLNRPVISSRARLAYASRSLLTSCPRQLQNIPSRIRSQSSPNDSWHQVVAPAQMQADPA